DASLASASVDELDARIDAAVPKARAACERILEDVRADRADDRDADLALERDGIAPLRSLADVLVPHASDTALEATRRSLLLDRVVAEQTRMRAEVVTETSLRAQRRRAAEIEILRRAVEAEKKAEKTTQERAE